MVWPFLIAVSFSVCWILSPDVLVRLGNGVAETRTLYLAALGISAVISALAVSLIRHPNLRHNGKCSQTGLLIEGIGKLPAMTIILACRISLILIIPTGLLVTGGFAFNEIFLYWFPNFGFSFVLLGIVCLLHLAGDRFARMAQPFFAATVLLSLAILCLAGLGGTASSNPVSVDIGFSFSFPVIAGSLLLFLGFDYATPDRENDSRTPALAALFFCLLLFIFWSMLSLQYVDAQELSKSTIPYMLTAREILGEPGRYLMGVAVISGVCAAVNGFFLLTTSGLADLSKRNLLPGHPPGKLKRRRFVILFSLIIGVFLMAGLAGHDVLETYIQASLILWLLFISMQCIAASRILNEVGISSIGKGLILGSIYCLCALYLITAHHQTTIIIRFLISVLAASAGISAFWLWKRPAYEITYPTVKKTGGQS